MKSSSAIANLKRYLDEGVITGLLGESIKTLVQEFEIMSLEFQRDRALQCSILVRTATMMAEAGGREGGNAVDEALERILRETEGIISREEVQANMARVAAIAELIEQRDPVVCWDADGPVRDSKLTAVVNAVVHGGPPDAA
jgi:hypothetical protein